MTDTKFTPGPWHVQHGVGVYAANGNLVASVHTPITVDGNSKDARLIASAPELWEALQEVFVIGDRLVSDVYGYEFVVKARAAIAKATQEQPK